MPRPNATSFLGGGSSFDVNGFTTSWGTLTDIQRTLDILNSNTTTAGAVTFNNLAISATATLQFGRRRGGRNRDPDQRHQPQLRAPRSFSADLVDLARDPTEELFSGAVRHRSSTASPRPGS